MFILSTNTTVTPAQYCEPLTPACLSCGVVLSHLLKLRKTQRTRERKTGSKT